MTNGSMDEMRFCCAYLPLPRPPGDILLQLQLFGIHLKDEESGVGL